MLLFIDRLPLLDLTPAVVDDDRAFGVPLPIVAAEDDDRRYRPTQPARFYPWLMDTAYTGQAHVWLSDLLALGLDPRRAMGRRARATRTVYGEQFVNRQRVAGLWLFSNIPALLDRPYLLPLSSGLEVHVPAVPIAPRGGLGLPLIGTRLLIRAGLQTHIDWARRQFSAWIPGSWLESWFQFPRRAIGGFARHSVAWHVAD